MRLTVVVTLAVLLTLTFALEAAAQRQPSGAPRVDLGAPSNRPPTGFDSPWSGPPGVQFGPPRGGVGPYFQPTPSPFQSSHTRRWQRKLEEVWGGIPADRGVPKFDRRYGFPPRGRDVIFVHPRPWPIIECFGTRCQRVYPPIR